MKLDIAHDARYFNRIRRGTNALGGGLGARKLGGERTDEGTKPMEVDPPRKGQKPKDAKINRHIGKPHTETIHGGKASSISNPKNAPGKYQKFVSKSTIASRTLVAFELTNIDRHSTSSTSDFTRAGDVIHFTDVWIDGLWVNRHTKPINVHIALVASKNSTDVTDGTTFFQGDGADDDVDLSTALTAVELDTLPINRDKYDVFYHTKFTLGKGYTDATVGTNSDYFAGSAGYPMMKRIKVNVPINKIVEYDGAAGTTATNAINMCMWCDEMFAEGGTATANTICEYNMLTTRGFLDRRR